jgi:predicted PurR-regulated permease PerM
MENNERYTDKLAKYILIAAAVCIAGLLCWSLRSVLGYILIAVVVSLIAKPVMGFFQKIGIRGKHAPSWVLAALSLVVVIGGILTVLSLVVPLITSIIKDVSMTNIEQTARSMAVPLNDLNTYLRECFPNLGSDFRIEVVIGQEVQKIFNVSAFSSIIGSAASMLTSFCIGIFSVAFIGFFFIKDDGLFTEIICESRSVVEYIP